LSTKAFRTVATARVVSDPAARFGVMEQVWGTTTGGATAVLDGVRCAGDRLVADLAGGGVRDLSHEQLTTLVDGLRRQQARLESVALAAVGEVDARGSVVHDGPGPRP